jgi:hypothetical protein
VARVNLWSAALSSGLWTAAQARVTGPFADLGYVAEYGTEGTGNDQLVGQLVFMADGTYLYVADRLNGRIVKRCAWAP